MLCIMLRQLLDIYFIGETDLITKSLLVNAIVIKKQYLYLTFSDYLQKLGHESS